ncbi:MAG: TIGR01212 family radical SAM protein [Lachnospiraceae bacterium]|nr:TIGR01212 family radical SAM protein [bacterium]MDY5516747.1 TIGR01212 family radical SAM protein [Lachnospiraceae bacterium]
MQPVILPESWLGKPYYSLNAYLRQTFGEKIYRLSLDGGFSCPNRDGTLGTRGCIFCSAGGSGDFAADRQKTVTEQLTEARQRIAAKTNAKHFIAYFQAYTNTYADISYLRTVFCEALFPEEVVALSIATRVDCIGDEVLQLLCELRETFRKPIWIELGVQSTYDESLQRVRSGFTYEDCEQAIMRLHDHNLPSIIHLILGLPGESREQMLHSVKQVCALPISGLKLQLLHVLSGTDLATEYEKKPFPVFEMEEYCQFVVTCIEHVPAHIVLHRITGDGPKKLLIAPLWSGDKKRVLNRIHAIFRERNTWQGRLSKKTYKREATDHM